MKTAISVPDALFEEGERLAQQLGVARSHLYTAALREYLKRHDADQVTRRLNEVYGNESSEPDRDLLKIASRALPRESWK
jgi:metal-responsive CopG/Arc/MetJ family transcriptional regulator